jgi:hypothetical protein
MGVQETACRDKNEDGRGFMGLNGGVWTTVCYVRQGRVRSDGERIINGNACKRRFCYVEGKGMITQGRNKNTMINDNPCNVQQQVASFIYIRYLMGFVARCWHYREAAGSNDRC